MPPSGMHIFLPVVLVSIVAITYNTQNTLNCSKPLLTIEGGRYKPSLGHGTIQVPFDISLALPDGRKHALDGIRASQALSLEARQPEPMERQDVLKSFHERIGSRFIDPPQPFLKLHKHPPCLFITVLLQRNLNRRWASFRTLRQMALNVPIRGSYTAGGSASSQIGL